MAGYKLIIQDNDKDIRELLAYGLEGYFPAEMVQTTSTAETLKVMSSDSSVLLVIASYARRGDEGEKLFSQLKQKGQAQRLIVYTEYPQEARSLFAGDIGDIVAHPNLLGPLQHAIAATLGALGQSVQANHQEYSRISIDTIFRFGELFADLYIRLSDQKFVKVFETGYIFDADDLERFRGKRVFHLWVQSSELKKLLDHMIRVMSTLPRPAAEGNQHSPSLNLDQIVAISETALEAIAGITHTFGFTPEAQTLAKQAVRSTVQVLEQNPALRDAWQLYRVNPERYIASHSVALAYVACGLASVLQWTSDLTFFKLSLAAFLHDISLPSDDLARPSSMPDVLARKPELTEANYNDILIHPEKAAEYVRQISELPPDIDSIVEQHHYRPDGSGFSKPYQPKDIHPLSGLFILAHELLDYQISHGQRAKPDLYLSELDAAWLAPPFKDLIKGLTKGLKG